MLPDPEWKIAGWLILAGIPIWFLMRLDEETRRNVEVRRNLWEGKSTYEKEFKKYQRLIRLICLIGIFLSLALALFSAIPLFRGQTVASQQGTERSGKLMAHECQQSRDLPTPYRVA